MKTRRQPARRQARSSSTKATPKHAAAKAAPKRIAVKTVSEHVVLPHPENLSVGVPELGTPPIYRFEPYVMFSAMRLSGPPAAFSNWSGQNRKQAGRHPVLVPEDIAKLRLKLEDYALKQPKRPRVDDEIDRVLEWVKEMGIPGRVTRRIVEDHVVTPTNKKKLFGQK
jgi:hypothetical protein